MADDFNIKWLMFLEELFHFLRSIKKYEYSDIIREYLKVNHWGVNNDRET